MRKIIGILDYDEKFGKALQHYFCAKNGPFDTIFFPDRDAVLKFCETNIIRLLICPMEWVDELKNKNIDQFILLTDKQNAYENKEYKSLIRYQSANLIYEEVLRQYETNSISVNRNSQTQIYTVFSPVSRCGKTMFSLALAKAYSEETSTLYLNFETFAGLNFLFCPDEKKLSISDALFLLSQNKLNEKMDKLFTNFRGFYVLLPAQCPEDIKELTREVQEKLIDSICQTNRFERIVIDVGSVVDMGYLLSKSKVIYVPTKEDEISKERIACMEEYLRKNGLGDYLEKFEKIQVPVVEIGPKKKQMDRIFVGEMSDFVKKVMEYQKG